MKLTWMSRYRGIVEAIIGMVNTYNQVVNNKVFTGKVTLSPAELQVLEYILENEDRNENMSRVAQRLSIPQSKFSRLVKQLVDKGVLEKYHTSDNSKNIIVKVSALGRDFYKDYSAGSCTDVWRRMFKMLDGLGEETIQIFIDCLNEFTREMQKNMKPRAAKSNRKVDLIKIDPSP